MSESSATSTTQSAATTQSATQETRVTRKRRYWRRNEGPVDWWPWGLIPLIGLPLLYLWGAFVTAPNIEDQVQETVTSNLANNGFAGAGVAAAGQIVDVDVALPAGEAAHARAVARSTRCDTWVGRLICPTDVGLDTRTVAEVEPAPAPVVQTAVVGRTHDFRLTVDGDTARIEGEAPDEKAHMHFVDEAHMHFENVEDDLRITGEAATDQWLLAADRAVYVSSKFERGSAVWASKSFSAQGLVLADQEAIARGEFNDAESAPNLGSLSLEVAKTNDSCNAEFAAALSESTINFASASATIDESSQSLLEALAQTANQCAGQLLIEGHTDSVGSEESNLNLSQERAGAVQVALNRLGVANGRVNAVGYGERQPSADNGTRAGQAQNRRIAIQIATN